MIDNDDDHDDNNDDVDDDDKKNIDDNPWFIYYCARKYFLQQLYWKRIDGFIDWLIDLLIDLLIDWLFDWLIDLLIDWFTLITHCHYNLHNELLEILYRFPKIIDARSRFLTAWSRFCVTCQNDRWWIEVLKYLIEILEFWLCS